MKNKIVLALFLCLSLCLHAQEQQIPTTPFARAFLRLNNSTAAANMLGISGNGIYPTWNFADCGDSLSWTNFYSNCQSYSSIMASYGFNIITNAAQPGVSSGIVNFPELDSVSVFAPTVTGQRCILLIQCGKNDQNGMAGDLVTMTNVSNGIETNIMFGLNKAWAMGFDPMVMTVHHTAHSPAGPAGWDNSEPCTAYVNSWINALPTATNLTGGRTVVIADIASLFPQNSYTNSNGTLNTSVTYDGEHLVGTAMTNEAALIANVITNGVIWRKSSITPSCAVGSAVSTNAAIALPSGSGVQNNAVAPYGQTAVFRMGSVNQPAYFEDAYWDIAGPLLQDIVGSAWVSGIDENTLATSGFRFMNHGRNWQFFVDTSDYAGIFVGATNLDKSVGYFGYPSLSIRGNQIFYPEPYQWYTTSTTPLQVSLRDEWGIFKVGVNYNGTPGILAFDGQTLTVSNLTTAGNIYATNYWFLNNQGIAVWEWDTQPTTAVNNPNGLNIYGLAPSPGALITQQGTNGVMVFTYPIGGGGTPFAPTPLLITNGLTVQAGSVVAPNYAGTWFQFTNAINGGTNATAPANTTTIRAWVNFTNITGGVFKMPLYQ